MKIKRLTNTLYQITDNSKSCHVSVYAGFSNIMRVICNLDLSVEEIGKIVILISSPTPDEVAKNLGIDYDISI